MGTYYVLAPTQQERVKEWGEEQVYVYGTVDNPTFTLQNEPIQPKIFAAIEDIFSQPGHTSNLEKLLQERGFPDFHDSALAQVIPAWGEKDRFDTRKIVETLPVPKETMANLKEYFAHLTGKSLPISGQDRAGIDFTSPPQGWSYSNYIDLKRAIPQNSFPATIGGTIAMAEQLGQIPAQHTAQLVINEEYDTSEPTRMMQRYDRQKILDNIGIPWKLPRVQPKNPEKFIEAFYLDRSVAFAHTEGMIRMMYTNDPTNAIRAKVAFENMLVETEAYAPEPREHYSPYLRHRKNHTLTETAAYLSSMPTKR
jgi:hypothetical protein